MDTNIKRLSQFLFIFSFFLLFIFCQETFAAGYDDKKFGVVCDSTMQYLQGGFGALLSAIAGFGAVIASAVGGFRMAWALVVVSVGAFIVKEYMEIWFGAGSCS